MQTRLFRRPAHWAAAVLFAQALAASRPSGTPPPKQRSVAAPPVVRIDNFTFSPAEITIASGTTLTWENADDSPHKIVATGKAFRSQAMDTDESYSFTFTAPGTYDYFCSLHPHMQGKVIVK